MSNSIISVENLSKRYLLGRKAKADGLRHVLEQALRSPLGWMRAGNGTGRAKPEEFWALRDLNFEVKEGEAVGIIGRNGAGKSTLLKILSRISPPTKGRISLRGRVSSLLEVGIGFHPELTGRENIFLNGAILGMGRLEIKDKFDEIVDFADLEKFLDTPVKRYSSGMYVRLAFAVAAHLEPEILIIDEVLAVGDAEFQKKCMSKMDDVAHTGRTVLFVSHNMQAVTRLCPRCILLHNGRVELDGPSVQIANAYQNTGITTSAARVWPDLNSAPGDETVRLCAVHVRSGEGEVADSIDIRKPVSIELEYEVFASGHKIVPHFVLKNQDGAVILVSLDLDPTWRGRRRPPGRYVSTGSLPGNLLQEGFIYVRVEIMSLDPEIEHVLVEESVAFRVVDDLSARDTSRGDYGKPMPGAVRPLLEWTTSVLPAAERSRGIDDAAGHTVAV